VKILLQGAGENSASLLLSLTCPSWHSAPATREQSWVLKRQMDTISPNTLPQLFLGLLYTGFSSPSPSAFPAAEGPADSSVTPHEDPNRNIQTPLLLQSTLLASHVSLAG